MTQPKATMTSGGDEILQGVNISIPLDPLTMKDGFGIDMYKAAALARVGVEAHCQANIPYIPTPFMLSGRIKIKDGAWMFGINNCNPSPLQAMTTPETAGLRILCLQNLASGLTLFDKRLLELYNADIRGIRHSDFEGMSPEMLAQDEYLWDLELHQDHLWKMYDQVYSRITGEILLWGDDEQGRFVLACLQVHCRAQALLASRYALAVCEGRMEAAGLEGAVVDTQIELGVWQHQLECKVREFCSEHPWVNLDLSRLVSSDGPRGTCGQFPFAASATESALGLQSRLMAQLQGNPGRPIQANVGLQFPVTQFVLSTLENFIGVRRGHSHSQDSFPQGPETDTDNSAGLNSGVECPICGLDLYVSPPDDPPREECRSTMHAKLGRNPQCVVNKFSSALIGSQKTATATTTIPDGPKGCMVTREFWLEHDHNEFIPPKPVFCPGCRHGCHKECFLKWNTPVPGIPARNRQDCPNCHTQREKQRREQQRRQRHEQRREQRREPRRLAKLRD